MSHTLRLHDARPCGFMARCRTQSIDLSSASLAGEGKKEYPLT